MTNGEINGNEEHFDCIEFKRRVQAEIYDEIKDMTHEEEIAYFRRTANECWIGEWWRSLKGDSQTVHETPQKNADDEAS